MTHLEEVPATEADEPSADPSAPSPGDPSGDEWDVRDDLAPMLEVLTRTIVEDLGFGVAVINLARPDGTLEVVSVAGDTAARDALLGTVDSGGSWDELLSRSESWGRLRFLDHAAEDARTDYLSWIPDIAPVEAPDAWHPEDALFAPLLASDGSRLGILSVDLPADGLRPGPVTCKALEAFAVSTALALEHATLRLEAAASERRFRHLATRDWLTGAGNRALLLERLRHAGTRRSEDRSPVALVFVDLDDFKSVNDTYSHLVGDHVLKAVARRLASVVRPHDTVVRWGGDEFLVLLEDVTDAVGAENVARRIVAVLNEPVHHRGHVLELTASVGVALGRVGSDRDAEELIHRADTAMYRAKLAGHGYALAPPMEAREIPLQAARPVPRADEDGRPGSRDMEAPTGETGEPAGRGSPTVDGSRPGGPEGG